MIKAKQGEIYKVNLNPVSGHEQANYRPVIVLQVTGLPVPGNTTIVAPITSAAKKYPLQVSLDDRTKTQGTVLCTQLRTLDLEARNARLIEEAPSDIVFECCDIVKHLFDSKI